MDHINGAPVYDASARPARTSISAPCQVPGTHGLAQRGGAPEDRPLRVHLPDGLRSKQPVGLDCTSDSMMCTHIRGIFNDGDYCTTSDSKNFVIAKINPANSSASNSCFLLLAKVSGSTASAA